MGLKEGAVLAVVYLALFLFSIPPSTTNSPTAALVWFLWPLVSTVDIILAALAGKFLFGMDLWPWTAITILASLLLTLLLSPIFTLLWGFYIVPTAVIFLVGLMEG